MLMQVLLGLAIMVLMTPLIMDQVKRRNRRIVREEAIARLVAIQGAASAYISFEEKNIPIGCFEYANGAMQELLRPFGGGELATANAFGQEYYIYVCHEHGRDGAERTEAFAGARGGDIDEEELYALGEYLFDQGAVVDAQGGVLSNYEIYIAPELVEKAQTQPNSLIMLVSGDFAVSDYLRIDPVYMAGGARNFTVNTMQVDIDMNGRPIKNALSMNGDAVELSKGIAAKRASGNSASFFGSASIGALFEVSGSSLEFGGSSIPIDAGKIAAERLNISGDVRALRLLFPAHDLIAEMLTLERLSITDDAELVGSAEGISFQSISAKEIRSDGETANEFNRVILGRGGSLIGGTVIDGGFVDKETIELRPDGISDVRDICWDARCISQDLLEAYQGLQEIRAYYIYILEQAAK